MAEQWEYLSVEIVFNAMQKNWQTSGSWGESSAGTINKVLIDLLTRLGGASWEIVSLTPSHGGTAYQVPNPKVKFTIDRYLALFKRRKP